METVIVTCLLILIALKLHDKMVSKKIRKRPTDPDIPNPNLPDIMGQPKSIESNRKPKTAIESQHPIQQPNLTNFDEEYDENEFIAIQIPQEEPDDDFSNMPYLNEEEEEWKRQELTGIDIESNLSQGVTYDELTTVGNWLQKENLEQSQKETAAVIVQKYRELNYSIYWKILLMVHPEKLPSFWIKHFQAKQKPALPLCGKMI